MKVLIIGGGNMGRTFAQSFLSAHVIRPKDLIILEKNPDALNSLRQQNIATVYEQADSYVKEVDLIVLAVKPQDATNLYPLIKPYLNSQQLVVSIMAGVTIEAIKQGLGIKKIIRAMPNLPAKVGMGMTAFTTNSSVSRDELLEVQNLLSTTGRAIYLDDEKMIDAATAISGSGPAYIYYFMSAMIEAAKDLGFKESHAELLVWQTFRGATYLYNKNNFSCEEWINMVASKGGTTEAAIRTFKEGEVNENIQNGVAAAFKRAVDLGK